MRGLLRMFVLLALLVAPFVASAANAAPTGPCRIIDPTTCSTNNALAHASGFTQALGHFVSGSKASYFKSDRSLSEQAMQGLGGPSEPVVALPDKHYLFAGCLSRE